MPLSPAPSPATRPRPGPPGGSPPAPPPPGGEAALRAALLDSRQRWRGLVALAGDLAFETDPDGRFTFVWPEGALGWPEASLVGRPAASVLLTPQDGFDPFAVLRPVRGRGAWVRRLDGGPTLLRFSVMPLPGGQGGVRGIASDVTLDHANTATVAAALRRAAVMDHVVACMQEEFLAPRMLGTVLQAAVAAMGADGAAVVLPDDGSTLARHETSPVPAPVRALACQAGDLDRPVHVADTDEDGGGASILACPVPDRLGIASLLVFWRVGPDLAQARAWLTDDRALALSLTGVVRAVLEQDQLLREMSRQARTDPLTGLLNRRAFADELERRLSRVHVSSSALPDQASSGHGVLLYLDLDGFKPVNDRHGHEAGDAVLVAVAGLLRHTFRPTDLLARLGGDEFAVWMDRADELTAAERADDLGGSLPEVTCGVLPEGASPVRVSIGIAPVDPAAPDGDELLRRADGAMFAAKVAGGGWHVAHARHHP